MQLETLSTCDWLYENTYPSCHSKRSGVSLWSLIYLDDHAFTLFINSETETAGLNPKKQCTWSSTPFIMMVFAIDFID